MSKPQMSCWFYLQLPYARRACTKRLDETQWPETRDASVLDRDERLVRLETETSRPTPHP